MLSEPPEHYRIRRNSSGVFWQAEKNNWFSLFFRYIPFKCTFKTEHTFQPQMLQQIIFKLLKLYTAEIRNNEID